MKKLILSLALMALVSIPASASIIWEVYGALFNGVRLSANDFENSLIMLIKINGDSVTPVDITKSFSPDSLGTIIYDGCPTDYSGDMVQAEVYFWKYKVQPTVGNYVVLFSHEENGETYYNLAREIRFVSSDFLTDTAFIDESVYYTLNSTVSDTTTLSLGSGWVKAVPEPATGALALAGVALLFRRRRQA